MYEKETTTSGTTFCALTYALKNRFIFIKKTTMERYIILLDLDGTVTAQETLPVIAQKLNLVDEIERMTQENSCRESALC